MHYMENRLFFIISGTNRMLCNKSVVDIVRWFYLEHMMLISVIVLQNGGL